MKIISTREEFEEELKKTLAYQDILEEGCEAGIQQGLQEGASKAKHETVPLLRELGSSDEVIATRLYLPIETAKRLDSAA